jgi:hypothetical protein
MLVMPVAPAAGTETPVNPPDAFGVVVFAAQTSIV